MILQYPNKKLRARCKIIKRINDLVIKDANRLLETARKINKIYRLIFGIAANQIGITKRIVVLKRLSGKFIIMVNPEITSSFMPFLSVEKCFSLKSIVKMKIRRFFVKVKYLSLDEQVNYVLLFGPSAFTMQQEIDHLDGKLIID